MPYFNKDSLWSPPPRLDLESTAISTLTQKLIYSLSLRTQNVPLLPLMTANLPRVAILFSGGLDCTVLARLVHEILPLEQEIDLLNVAFENPRVLRASGISGMGISRSNLAVSSTFSNCPDRLTGWTSHKELLGICPDRLWRFVSIDIPYSETLQHRPQIISLIHPHNTEMDLSIACALYFAARGSGQIPGDENGCTTSYVTPARVLLSGLGADELFAGYSRHATAFDHRGYKGLVDELELDFNRLGQRNLGRDDRVISHWGREVRYPYLDEDLVSWTLGLPVVEKCGFGQGQSNGTDFTDHEYADIEPGKKLLRLLAWKLGLKRAALERKRAIQFGARTAKMETGRIKGNRLLS
jgi:asparagine synthetase B (glutamine-hydrolysing)